MQCIFPEFHTCALIFFALIIKHKYSKCGKDHNKNKKIAILAISNYIFFPLHQYSLLYCFHFSKITRINVIKVLTIKTNKISYRSELKFGKCLEFLFWEKKIQNGAIIQDCRRTLYASLYTEAYNEVYMDTCYSYHCLEPSLRGVDHQ
jgi:hypothetical protein